MKNLSARNDIEYVRLPPMKGMHEMVEAFKKQLDEVKDYSDWTSRDCYIIFVTYMEDGVYVAQQLGIDFYHATSLKYPITSDQ